MRQLKITKSITNRESASLDKYLQEIGKEELITVEEATNLVYDLRENHKLFCSIVVYPVIPRGEIILRVIPTAAHTMEDVEYTLNAFKSVRDRLMSGGYKGLPMPQMAEW